MRDQTELAKQQEEAAAAKAKSERLLFQILPRDIVIRLNQDERDISFSVPQASIIFIDVVKFSEYSALLSPSEIMGNLSNLFAAFDAAAKKYTLLTKIKLIGDIYMAASGLFAGEDQPSNDHALQIVCFGLDCIADLDDVNQALSATLQVRAGVNSGGPVIAGVLGTDRPVFDIIGDPINVAARLQTTDVPGKVQIPQSTFELIQGGHFKIEQRGETFLKGKGHTMTYLVSPWNPEFPDSSMFESGLGSGIGLLTAGRLPNPASAQPGRAPPS
jgi:class 3 adenylate cyclase